ncbi:MAG: exosortase/archaeosortase family protein, partial [Pirellula sp.]
MIFLQCQNLWARPHFQFFPIAWGAFAYFVYTRASLQDCKGTTRRNLAYLILAACCLLTLLTITLWSPWIGYMTGILLVCSWGLLRLGETSWTTVLAMSTLLWITLPLPLAYDQKLISLLQSQSSFAAGVVLDCFGVVHLRGGNVIELASKRLFVDEACSGVDSLYALMTICLGMIVWFRLPFIVGFLSILLVPMWTSCSNILRLVSIALGLDWFRIDLSHGTPHTVLGLIVFVAAFLADYSFIQFCGGLFWRVFGESRSVPVTSIQPTRLLGKPSRWMVSSFFVLAGTYL